jgi:DNA invertase Pin-like site-specific DNA recombinase
MKGDSIRRQMELSERYCKDNGLVLDNTLKLTDMGISAFKGTNATEGKLGAFIQAVDDGKVEPGSILLIESLDRLSRDKAITALALLNKILEKDILVATLSDNQLYTKDNINDMGKLFYSLVVMCRANEESEMKSRRSIAVNVEKQRKAIENGTPKTKAVPAWLELVDGKFHLKPDAVKTVQTIYELYASGYGYSLVAKHLNNEGIPTFDAFNGRKAKHWHMTYIVKILKNESVIGTHQEIENYFPTAIENDLFKRVQLLISQKSTKNSAGRKSSTPNIFVNIVKCGYCGSPMVLHTSTDKGKKYPAFRCYAARYSGSCSRGKAKNWSMPQVEKLLLAAITEIDLDTVFKKDDEITGLKILADKISSIEYDLSQVLKKKRRNIEAMEDEDDDSLAKEYAARVKELSIQEKALGQELESMKEEYSLAQSFSSDAKNAQNKVKEMLQHLAENDFRLALNQELKKIIERIELFNYDKKFIIRYKGEKSKGSFVKNVIWEKDNGGHHKLIELPVSMGEKERPIMKKHNINLSKK